MVSKWNAWVHVKDCITNRMSLQPGRKKLPVCVCVRGGLWHASVITCSSASDQYSVSCLDQYGMHLELINRPDQSGWSICLIQYALINMSDQYA